MLRSDNIYSLRLNPWSSSMNLGRYCIQSWFTCTWNWFTTIILPRLNNWWRNLVAIWKNTIRTIWESCQTLPNGSKWRGTSWPTRSSEKHRLWLLKRTGKVIEYTYKFVLFFSDRINSSSECPETRFPYSNGTCKRRNTAFCWILYRSISTSICTKVWQEINSR